jgi:3-oxoacyl-[acyl-carrier-protein] synthase-3
MPNAYISGTGSYVPARVVTNEDLARELGTETSHEWIVQRTGIEQRRFAEEGLGTSEMGERAARQALDAAGIAAHEIDMILFATLSPDFQFPGCGVLLQHRLGLNDGPHARCVPAMDIRNQCSGFLYGLATADALVRSGSYRHVLLVGAETHSHALDRTPRGRTVASLFGDGAAAVIVSATEEDRGIRSVILGSSGAHAEVLSQKVWDIRQIPFIPQDDAGRGLVEPEMMWAHMDGKLVFRNAIARMSSALMEVTSKTHTDLESVDVFLFHQANLRINEYLANSLKLPAHKIPHNIHKYGNTTAATIPLLADETVRDGRLRPGMKVAMAAFGSGFTWGAAIVDW